MVLNKRDVSERINLLEERGHGQCPCGFDKCCSGGDGDDAFCNRDTSSYAGRVL